MKFVNDNKWIAYADEILKFLEEYAWPLRLDLLIQRGENTTHSEAEIQEIVAQIEAHPEIRDEWLKLPAPQKKGEEGGAAGMTIIERVRIHGSRRTRVYLVGAKFRHAFPATENLKEENWIVNPFPSWRAFERVFRDEDFHLELKAECVLLVDLFLKWLSLGTRKSALPRVKRWLDERFQVWAELLSQLEEEAKAGEESPISMIIRSQILFDIGRATLFADSEASQQQWAKSEKNEEPRPLVLWREQARLGFNSAQIAALWAQSLGLSSSLATPLRLLSRPWRANHSQVKRTHAATVRYLDELARKKTA